MDYKGFNLEIAQPSQFQPLRLPPIDLPQIVVPYMHIGDSFELMRFEFEESSEYSKLLRGYPKRISEKRDLEISNPASETIELPIS
jgi:hypothetical protein